MNSEELGSVLAGWTDADHGTLAQRLAHAVRRGVQSGMLSDGTLLPAERAIASALAISRSTVTAALDELRAEGLVESRQGSGTRVCNRYAPAISGTRIAEHFSTAQGIDLAAGNPLDAAHLPPLQVDVATLLAGGGPGVQPLGLPALRAALADHDSERGRPTTPDQVHVTAGGHQAVSLALGAVATRNTPVVVEDTSYPGVFDIIDSLGARPVPVRTDGAGLVPEELDRALAEHRPVAIYTQNGPHNPTGLVPTSERLRALAAVCDRHDTTVVEDRALAELAFAGPMPVELADLCRSATVVSAGSFSKVAWGGLRVGWLRAPEAFIERTMYLRLANDLGPSVPSQLLVLQLLPQLDELAARRRAGLSEIVGRAVEYLRTELPDWTVTEPAGGSVLWVALPVADTGSYVPLAARHGAHVAPGSIAVPARAPSSRIRICVDRPWDTVQDGIRRLRLAWRELASTEQRVLG
ncbi:DNA-binding transcriptional regulator, MocR family, contains an aminotransferase domain [Haloechinothrix alba]|uniref:DNA-binding transcriptional regulator, MocR family, contains an aminotransferase domain n=1 Tax=Haloechinothrix alba TaxID=664784 RepID=A0A238W3S2_9PSEU|nr:PLP-dependent aminotransferase family protein [Haloechinothrix alba]SNR41047.1 DNA-binding transcriptional regulator, MocR family, contains an aminotransferase domain [Haloechinothrix alba]